MGLRCPISDSGWSLLRFYLFYYGSKPRCNIIFPRVANSLFSLLRLDLPEVELELLALKNVSVGAAGLAGARRNGGDDTAGLELILESLLNLEK